MPEKFDIVGFGICAVDFLGLVSNYPAAGQKVLMTAFSKQGGGNTATALVTAARSGACAAYLGKLGTDEHSQFVLREFEKEGVETQFVLQEEGAQPHLSFVHVHVKTGERRITRYWQNRDLKPEELNRSLIENSRILFLDHYYTVAGLAAAKWIKQSGGQVVLDAERPTPDLEEIARLADAVIASSQFAEKITGISEPAKSVRELQTRYGDLAIVTAGENGAFCQSENGCLHQPAFQVPVVDTTGAGDVFHGAFAAGLLENWPLPKILEFAAAVAALKCRGLGGRAMIPTKKEALVFLNKKGTPEFWR